MPFEGQSTLKVGQITTVLQLPSWLSRWRIHLQCGRLGFDPWVGKIPWRRAWKPTPVFLPRESPWRSPPCSSDHGDSPSKNTGMGFHSFLQGIFPTKGSNPHHPHCRQSLSSEPPVKPKNTGVSSLSLLQQIFQIQESNQHLLWFPWILYIWATREELHWNADS